MKKRILSLILSFCLILSLVPVVYAAETDVTMETSPVSGVRAGDEFTVTVTFPATSTAHKAYAIGMKYKYDDTKFTVKSFTPPSYNGTAASAYKAADGTISCTYMGESGGTTIDCSTAVKFVATFTVNTGVTAGAYDFSLDTAATMCKSLEADGYTEIDLVTVPSGTKTSVTILKAPITSVTIADLDAPVKGDAPDTSVTVTPSSLAADVKWFDGETQVTGKFAASTKYTVKIKLTASGGDNFAGTVTASDYTVTRNSDTELLLTRTFGVTANKDTPTINTVPTASAITYGQKLSNSTLTGGEAKVGSAVISGTFMWKTGTIAPQVKDSNSAEYEVVFKPNDTASYETATCKVKLEVKPKELRTLSIIPIDDQTYTGEEIRPKVTVKDGQPPYDELAESDYSVTYSNNTNVGTANYTIKETPTGNYKFNTSYGTFKIKAADSSIFITGDPSKTYDGNVVADPTVTKSGSSGAVTFTYYSDKDCTTKTNNANNGAASDGTAPMNAGVYWVTATVAAAGNYGAATSVAKKFTISKKDIGEATIVFGTQATYDGSAKNVGISKVTVDGRDLISTIDYTIESGNTATDVGNTTLVIKGKGNYNGTAQKDWTLEKATPQVSDFNIPGLGAGYNYTGNPWPVLAPTLKSPKNGAGKVTVYYEGTSGTTYAGSTTAPTDAGSYSVTFNVAEGQNFNAATGLSIGTLKIKKVNYTGTTTFTETVRSGQATTNKTLTLPTLPAGASYGAPTVGGTTAALISAQSVSGTTLTYSTTSQANNTSATITIPVTGATNYNNYNVVVTVTAKDKENAGVSITSTISDKTYGDANFTVTATKTASNGGTWSWSSSDDTILKIVSGANSATATVQVLKASATGVTLTVTYESDTHMGTATTAIIKVNPKDVTAAMIASIPAQTYTGSAIQPKPAVKDGVALVEGTDFTYSYDVNTDVAAGGKVTITGQGNYKGTADKTFTISPKNINGATISLASASLPYNGSEQTVSITSVTLTGWTPTINTGDYKIQTGTNSHTSAGNYTLIIDGQGNYTGTASTTWKITAIDPVLANFDVTPALSTAQTYDGAHKTVTVVPKSGVNGMGTVKVYYEATAGITYPKSETAPTDVGTYKVTASVAAGSNYNAKDIDVGTLTINQATGGTLAAYNFQQKYTDLTAKTITPDYSDLPAGQTWTYSTPTPTTSGTAAVTDTSIGADTGVLSYTLTDGAKDNTVKWTVTISSHNYADFTKEVTLTLTDKDDQAALTLTGGTTVVYGETLQLGTTGGSGTGAVTYAVTNGTGEATIDATGKLTPTKAGTVTVTATKAADANYNPVTSAPVTITITKATPTGAPGYTAITTEGKTLADAGLTVGTITPAGTIKWVAKNGADLADNTAVEANKSYSWVFTPTDTANYETLTGSIQLWHKSTGGRYYYSSSNSSGTATITAVLTAKDAKSATDYTSGIYGLTFRSTADFSGFKGVKVDGKTIGKDNYVAESNNGSIEVYLKAAYLKTLAVGRHTLTIMATGGNASIDFTIGGVNTAPKTFDAGIAVYVTMAVASVTGMAWMGKKRED